MSTIVAREAHATRPAAVSVAVVLTVILTVAGLPLFLLLPGGDEIPGPVIVFSIVTGLVTLLGAWGLWQLRRWGAILTFVLTLLNVLASLPGFVEQPSGWIVALLIVSTPLSIAVLVMIALRSSRRSYR